MTKQEILTAALTGGLNLSTKRLDELYEWVNCDNTVDVQSLIVRGRSREYIEVYKSIKPEMRRDLSMTTFIKIIENSSDNSKAMLECIAKTIAEINYNDVYKDVIYFVTACSKGQFGSLDKIGLKKVKILSDILYNVYGIDWK